MAKNNVIYTIRGYELGLVTSAMQKSIRRGDAKLAGYFALELFHSGYWRYLWKRLMVTSAEDCWGIITKEIKALFDGFQMVNKGASAKEKGRIFISKAVIILCAAKKCRDADHLQNYVYDKRKTISDEEINKVFKMVEKEHHEIPGYAYDCHTRQGRRRGQTKEHFFQSEQKALNPKQQGLFDNIIKD